MDGQTYLVLEALGHPDRAAVVARLLEGGAREKDLIRELNLTQGTANRHFTLLRQVGLVRRDSRHGPYELTAHAETRAALEAANLLATSVLKARLEHDEALGRRIRRTRFRGSVDANADTSPS